MGKQEKEAYEIMRYLELMDATLARKPGESGGYDPYNQNGPARTERQPKDTVTWYG